ncbi:hypothetical protein YC2023_079636 [Brassica napus]
MIVTRNNFGTRENQAYPVIFEILFLIAFAVKSLIILLLTWLLDIHGEAHYSTCIGSITDHGFKGAILQIISHGFIGATRFLLAGTSYDRIRLVYLDEMGGMAISIPKIFTMFTILSMASLALSGMSGFVAE